MNNPDKLFLDIAERVANESSCISLHVGAVLVKDNRIISIGFNGTPSGYPHCNDEYSRGAFTRSEHHDWSIRHEIHAEMNAILFAAKSGIPVEGCTLYITHEPCDNCLKNCVAAGISRIVYKYPCVQRPHGDTFCGDFRNSYITIERFLEE